MRSWRSAVIRNRDSVSRRLAVTGVAAVALAGTVAGVAMATASPGQGRTRPSAATRPEASTAAPPVGRAHASSAPATTTPTSGQGSTDRLRTSCGSVAHIGDSTSVDLISPGYLPDPAQRLGARYAAVGVQHLLIDASGGRSIVEELPGQVNGYNVARAWHSQRFGGCWVFALGTNDAANVAVGSSVGPAARIDEMMSVAHGQPVMWVNTLTQLSSGAWADSNERAWDAALVQALPRYPNMRIFDWAAVARPGWFLPDGIHYNSGGCAERAQAIADALARAFPLHGHSKSQIVS
jgi:hypothetical protein